MADGSLIEWTDATWQIITGCSIVSKGCRDCYAMGLAGTRLRNHPSRIGLTQPSKAGPVWTGEVRFNDQWLDQPLRWQRPRRIFVCAHSDLFHENVPDEWIDKVVAVMATAKHHKFQVLTKRPERARAYLTALHDEPALATARRLAAVWPANTPTPRDGITIPLPNVCLMTSCEDQATADQRIPELLATPAALRGVSLEPLLGPIDLTFALGLEDPLRNRSTAEREGWGLFESGDGTLVLEQDNESNRFANGLEAMLFVRGRAAEGSPYHAAAIRLHKTSAPASVLPIVDWVIVGGESGNNARPMLIAWVRSLRDQCRAAGIAFFFKQHGEWIDADHWLDHIEEGPSELIVGGKKWEPVRPLNFEDAERLARLSGRARFEHHSDGTTLIRVGKKAGGRHLDGREWSEFPEQRIAA